MAGALSSAIVICDRTLAWAARPAPILRAAPQLHHPQLSQQGIPAVTLVRLVPVAPFSIVNLAAGAIAIPAFDYLVGTAIGLAPGLTLMSVLGEQATTLLREPTLGGIALLVGLLVGAIGISVALPRLMARRRAAGRRRPGGRRLSENMP